MHHIFKDFVLADSRFQVQSNLKSPKLNVRFKLYLRILFFLKMLKVLFDLKRYTALFYKLPDIHIIYIDSKLVDGLEKTVMQVARRITYYEKKIFFIHKLYKLRI